MTYVIDWDRAEGHATWASIVTPCRSCGGKGCQDCDWFGTEQTTNLRTWGADSWQDLCLVLRDMGYPDAGATVIDERGVPCWTIASVHASARWYFPTPEQLAERVERRKRQ